MELSNVALTKIGDKDEPLYKMLEAATPDAQLTRDEQILVTLTMPEMKIPSGPNHRAEGIANGEKIREASAKAKQALEAIEGLTIDNFFGSVGSAMVSGPAKAIAAMLELPEVKGAGSWKGVTFVPAADRGR